MDRKLKIALCLLTVAIVAVGLWQLAPRLMEQRDLHFGKQAYQVETEQRAAALPIQYVASELCAQCHQQQHDQWLEAEHSTIACETCHGPGWAHIEAGARLTLDTSRESCGTCHDELDARPRDFPQIDLAQHNSPSACVTCHNPMASAPQVPHPVEQGADCLSCHGPQGFKPLPESHLGRSSEVCQLCHQVSQLLPASTPTPSAAVTPPTPTPETSGPAIPSVVPHPLEGRSDCLMCHGPTGFKPFPADHAGRTSNLCLACHERK